MNTEDPCKRWLIAPKLVRSQEFEQDVTLAAETTPVTKVIPAGPRRWSRWIDIVGLFSGPGDPLVERAELPDDVRDPWGL